jgi:iron complex transport system ATP-binding protein
LDEPTTYLDIYHQIELLELIKSLNMKLGLTIVMVLHDINQAIRYSDNVIVMKNGEILAIGKPGEVITADVIRTVYGVNVAVKQGEDTGMYIVPLGYGG